LLALFVGANWLPRPGPTLLKSLLMAAGGQSLPLALGTLFLFGLGAALPLIAFGRLIRWFFGSGVRRLADGLAGKRLLGLALIAVAAMGLGGRDLTFIHWADTILPAWIAKLASTF
jgi:cytochrome c-type biogenesis protein